MMPLSMPAHLSAAVANAPLTHEWNSEIEDDLLVEKPVLTDRISEMSFRAALAFTVGCLEWTVWRFSKVLEGPEAFYAVEAAWAAIIDWRYIKSFDFPEFDDPLPPEASGPLNQAFWFAREALVLAKSGQPFWQQAASSSELVRKVTPDPEWFKSWRRLAIERLVECYPRPQHPLGAPVPRKLLEPEASCDPERVQQYFAHFFAELDVAENPYLRSPEEMMALGFHGTPYSL